MNAVQSFYEERLSRAPELAGCVPALVTAHEALAACFQAGGKLLLAGNGGSFADCLHIAGELLKSFERARPLPADLMAALQAKPLGEPLSHALQVGLPAVVLGTNGAFVTAMLNDLEDGRLVLAQECLALGRAGDVLLGISTSGNAEDVLMAMNVAATRGLRVLTLTGTPGGRMADAADVAVRTPGVSVASIQENHVIVYHALCAGLEAALFADGGAA